MSQAIVSKAQAQSYEAILNAYEAGLKFSPFHVHVVLPAVTTCCFEGAER